MPDPNDFDNEKDFMAACVPMAVEEGKDQDQAVAICSAMWEDKGKKAKPTPEFKSFPLSVQGAEGRRIKSFYAVMGRVDDGGDRIFNNAFAKTLNEHMKRVQSLWQHDASQPPIGVPQLIKEIPGNELPGDYKSLFPTATGGLYGEVDYLDTPRGNEVLTGILNGAIKENSIGYDTLQYDYSNERERKIRNLREVRLWDISPVNWGMQPAAINFKEAMVKFHMGELDIPGMIPELLRVFTGESKEGRVLSARNLEKLKQALETLNQLLFAAEPPQNDEFVKAFTQQLRLRIAIAEKELY